MANMGKVHNSFRPPSNTGKRKSIFEPSKFPEPSPNINPSPETTDLSGYRQPQSGEMMANVMDSVSNSKSASPPSYLTGKQLPAPKRQERAVNMASVSQLKAPPRQSNLSEKPIQKQEESIPNQTGLPDNLKAGVENLSGYSFDNVRVHYNSPKPAQLQALAYTQGTNIHVAPGQEKHLPHEAWHVVQQMQGRVKPTMQMKGVQINDDGGLEREADVMGAKIQAIGNRDYCKQTMESNSLIQSSISAKSPQQLKLDSSSSGDVIQRAVNTWGGSFKTSNYKLTKGIDTDGHVIGADIKIHFTPGEKCPKNTKIGLIQIVRVINAKENKGLPQFLKPTKRWAIDREKHSNPVYGSADYKSADPENRQRSKKLTDNPPEITEEKTEEKMKDPVKWLTNPPGAEVGAQLGERPTVGSNKDAILIDSPWVYVQSGKQAQYFETTAVILEGESKGLALGTVSWGWTKEQLPPEEFDEDNPLGWIKGDQEKYKAQLEPFKLVKKTGSSKNFEAAKRVWNGLADEHELVPIPKIDKGCFLTTACVEYMGLSDDCEELTTLRKFRDTYLLGKPNGKELIKLYYEHSPKIVAAIHEQDNEEEILKDLYKIIRQCVNSIQQGDNEWAYQTYCSMVMQLKEKFIPEAKIPITSDL